MHPTKQPSHEVKVTQGDGELTDEEYQRYTMAKEQQHRHALGWAWFIIFAGLIFVPIGIFAVRWSLGLL